MTEQKINKSAFVDSSGKVWGNVGENIRNGSKNLKSTFDSLDENELRNLPVIPIKGHWEYIIDTVDSFLIHSFSNYSINSSDRYAELSCKIYSIILVNTDNTDPIQSICLPVVINDVTYIEFLSNATIECTNEFLIYIGDE
jgi:hypothetical protein|nr:MAG TPA: hypothetical protein [Caudoviricetes sp.]